MEKVMPLARSANGRCKGLQEYLGDCHDVDSPSGVGIQKMNVGQIKKSGRSEGYLQVPKGAAIENRVTQ